MASYLQQKSFIFWQALLHDKDKEEAVLSHLKCGPGLLASW